MKFDRFFTSLSISKSLNVSTNIYFASKIMKMNVFGSTKEASNWIKIASIMLAAIMI